ncbi:hypothetical protein XELAEV_18000878mg [Xenopus laevis]|nr:hypothetical protein XELAEV_18000878mg [Xenopus laevis]
MAAAASNGNGMEVDVAALPSVMAQGVTGSVTVALHPLVILNISDHWIRMRSQEGRPMQGNVPLAPNLPSLSLSMDSPGFTHSLTLRREKSGSRRDRAGLAVGEMLYSAARELHIFLTRVLVPRQVCEIIESPLFLKLNPMTKHTDLPVSVYESVIDIVNGEATMLLAELSYTLATEEAERIGVDHVARMTATGSGENSTVAEHLIAQHSAIKMLHSRVRLILEYVRAAEGGEVPFNHEILREASALCHCLPVLSTDKFKTDFYDQCNDVGLMSYLGTITKTCNTMNQFVNKFNILYDRQGIGRRMRGLFF